MDRAPTTALVLDHEPPTSDRWLLLDRDGVVVENRDDYIRAWDDVVIFEHAASALRRAGDAGFSIALVTNQSVVGRGIVAASEIVDIHQRIVEALADEGGTVHRSALCLHAPDDDCGCRKPRTGMLETLAATAPVDRSTSWFVGDAATDIACAEAFDVASLFVLTGRGRAQRSLLGDLQPTAVVADLAAAVDRVVA